VLSATLAGLAGATKALVFQLASLTDVHWPMSGEVVLMTLVGGSARCSARWSARGHRHHAELPRRRSAQWVLVIQGVIFVVCVLLFRRGIVGERSCMSWPGLSRPCPS
jgi:branched-chain amino acid transport system permease protein